MLKSASGFDVLRPGEAAHSRRRRWLIVFLLFLVLVANSVDKAVLGFAAEPMMKELGISVEQYGLLASGFYSLFAVGGLLVAVFVAPRVRPRYILAILLLIWTISQLPIIFAASFYMLLGCRVILGMGEGAGTPTALTCCHEWFANEDRNMPSAVVMFGTTAGPLVAAPVLSHIIDIWGWRAAFLACSVLGGVILLLWMLLSADGPYAARSASADVASEKGSNIAQRELWTDGTVIGLCVIGFTAYWITSFVIAWLAPFVSLGLGYSLVDAGWILSSMHAGHAVLLFGLTYFSQKMLQHGHASRSARGLLMGFCMIAGAIAFVVAAYVSDDSLKLVAVALATGLAAPIYPLSASMISEVAPPAHRNRLVTTIFAGITTAGIASPALTGWAVARDAASGWYYALMLQAVVAVIGGIAAFAMLHPARSIERFERR